MPSVSAGLLLYRRVAVRETGGRRLEVLLLHPGGPYRAKEDAGAWSILKGEAEPDELGPTPTTVTASKARNRAAGVDLLAVARRAAREETGLEPEGPFQPLGGVKAHHHKLIYAWAVEYDCDAVKGACRAPATARPPSLGSRAESAGIGRAAWFALPAARAAIVPAQRRFIDDLEIVAGGA